MMPRLLHFKIKECPAMAKVATRTITHGKVVEGKIVETTFNEGDELKGLSAAEIAALGDAAKDGDTKTPAAK
jgi:hypothetical protein